MTSVWENQPFIRNIPAGNLLMSAYILYAGALPTKSLRVFQHMNCAVISLTTFFRPQQQYLYPAVASVWKEQQFDLLGKLQREKKPLMLGGDGRADSPEHSAKYRSYTFMDLTTSHILDFQLVQVEEKCVLYTYYTCTHRVMKLKVVITWRWRD